jgi:1-acyl-sn-glycerol-3-phosphate acyltransferase
MSYEKWSLGYWCLKQYVIFANWLIHKNTVITGLENIPENKPLVFAPNHQNALSDPLAILLNTPFQPVWLARADIFGKSKIVNSILTFLKIMPVYRIRDGKKNLEKNEKTFADSINVLKNNSALALFPEAAHSAKRQMLAHKKAVPRIVFLAEDRTGNSLDIQIIPAGIYYSHYWKFNRSLIVNFGKPIPVKNYINPYIENPVSAITELKNKIHDEIMQLVLNINSKKYYTGFETIREIYGRHFLTRCNKKYSLLNQFQSDKILVKKLDSLEKSSPGQTEELVKEATTYYDQVKKLYLRCWLFNEKQNHLQTVLLNILILIAGIPLFLFGFIFNAIPFFIIDKVIRKKVKDKSFWSTFFLVAGIILFPLFYLIEFFSLAWLIPWLWVKLLFLLAMPFAGKLAFGWYICYRKTAGRIRFLWLKFFSTKKFNSLINLKNSLLKKLDTLIESQ